MEGLVPVQRIGFYGKPFQIPGPMGDACVLAWER